MRHRGLDGLRAVAVMLVVVRHGLGTPGDLFDPWNLGPIGVRLFFVLSGFLITDILLRARRQAEGTDVSRRQVWLAFYIRRSLRIFPLAFAAIGVAWLCDALNVREHIWWYITYASNVLAAIQRANVGPLGHFWSLAVEEQFYLVWPLVLLLVPWHRLSIAIVAMIAGAVIVRVVLAAHGDTVAAYVLMPARLDALAVGGWMAWRVSTGQALRPLLMAAIGVVMTLVGMLGGAGTRAMLCETGMVIVSAAVILAVSRNAPGWRWLSTGPLVYLGTISYGIYVWHYLVAAIAHAIERWLGIWLRIPERWSWPYLLVTASGAIALASISWFAFERPLNDLKRFAPYVRQRLGAPPRAGTHPTPMGD